MSIQMNDKGYWFTTELISLTNLIQKETFEEAIARIREFVRTRVSYSTSGSGWEHHEFLDSSYIHIDYDNEQIQIYDGDPTDN